MPYGVQNLLYPILTNVTISPFILACMTSRSLESVLAVWHGIASHKLVDSQNENNSVLSIDTVPFIVSTVFSAVSFVVIGGLVRRKIKKLAEKERHRKGARDIEVIEADGEHKSSAVVGDEREYNICEAFGDEEVSNRQQQDTDRNDRSEDVGMLPNMQSPATTKSAMELATHESDVIS
jgi:hypothetical protein